MRLEPEAVDVLRELDPKIGAGEVGVESVWSVDQTAAGIANRVLGRNAENAGIELDVRSRKPFSCLR